MRSVAWSIAALGLVLLAAAPPAQATVTPYGAAAPSAMDVAKAIVRGEAVGPGTLVTGASWVTFPGGTSTLPSPSCLSIGGTSEPVGTSNAVITTDFGIPDGTMFGVLTNGKAVEAADPGAGASTCIGGTARGANDVVIHQIELEVPADANCLSLKLQFLSEEYPTYVGTDFNDAFIAEVDTNSWSVIGSTISAPDNFAFAPGGAPITVTSLGSPVGGGDMLPSHATGSPYGGASPKYEVRTPITPGPHDLYLSIFDASDSALDSAVFVDDLHALHVVDLDAGCLEGVTDVTPVLPEAIPVADPPAACGDLTVDFEDLSTWDPSLGAEAIWDFGDGTVVHFTPPSASTTHTYPEPGTYTVALTILDGADAFDTAYVVVRLCADPLPPLVADVDGAPDACAPVAVEFTDASLGTGNLQVRWSFGDGATLDLPSQQRSVQHLYDAPGVYTVTLDVLDGFGQESTDTLRITICSDAIGPTDADRDGVSDDQDNCPTIPNHLQEDHDLDGQGDACEARLLGDDLRSTGERVVGPAADGDLDGIQDALDGCPNVPDPRQADLDADGVGDACDADLDGDGVPQGGEFPDLCPLVADGAQADADGDGLGDACDPQPLPAGRGCAEACDPQQRGSAARPAPGPGLVLGLTLMAGMAWAKRRPGRGRGGPRRR